MSAYIFGCVWNAAMNTCGSGGGTTGCVTQPAGATTEAGYCNDNINNDCDAYTDGGDSDCTGTASGCANSVTEPTCNTSPGCFWDYNVNQCKSSSAPPPGGGTATCMPDPPGMATEAGYCSDGKDNDCNSGPDCIDPDCAGVSTCAAMGGGCNFNIF